MLVNMFLHNVSKNESKELSQYSGCENEYVKAVFFKILVPNNLPKGQRISRIISWMSDLWTASKARRGDVFR